MTNREKAIKYMRELKLKSEIEENFDKGILMCSLSDGVVLPAPTWQRKKAQEIEDHYSFDHTVVWHVVHDAIQTGVSYDDIMEVDAYLVVSDSVPDKLMVYDVDDEKVFVTYVYVHNLSIPHYSEYGETAIAECGGGVIRI